MLILASEEKHVKSFLANTVCGEVKEYFFLRDATRSLSLTTPYIFVNIFEKFGIYHYFQR